MNLNGTVTMSLDDYERLNNVLKERKELIEQYDESLTKAMDGNETVVSWFIRGGWSRTEYRIINPSNHVKEMKRQIDALNDENKRLREEKKTKRNFHFWNWLPIIDR